jgi:hypothetical protein
MVLCNGIWHLLYLTGLRKFSHVIPRIIVGASVKLVLSQPYKHITFDVKVSWVGWLEP